MLRTIAGTGCILLLSWIVFAQSNDKANFEISDVHTSAAASFPQMINGGIHEGRYELRNATMWDLVKTAYGVDDEKLFGGPSWLETDRFDVIAKVPAGASAASVKTMLQTLLAERFKLQVHNDTKPVPAYVLTVGKGGSKLKPSTSDDKGCKPKPQQAPPAPGALPGPVTAICHNLTSAEIAENLRMIAGGYFDHAVVDQTHLEGAFDFELTWTGRGLLSSAGSSGISIFDAVDKQLGLKVELQKAPGPVLVIDTVNRKPTDNPPNVAQVLPISRPEFEAVDVKLSAPGDERNFIRPSPGGRWDASGPLRNTVGFAYDIPGNLRADLMVVPKWIETYHIDVVAKAPTSGPASASGPRGGPAGAITDDITLRKMVNSLLEDRFKLKVHFEDREATVYAITPPKAEPKLRKADESERSFCKPDATALPTTGNAGPMIAIRCQNTTIAELAHNLPLWAGGYVDHPVVDTSGIRGGYDFVLMWTPRGFLETPARPADTSGGAVSALDPGGIGVFDAIDKQLGLKLEKQKHTLSVLVVDNVEPLKQ